MPGAKVAGAAREACCEPVVELRLPARERLRRDPVGRVQRREQASLVHLARGDGQCEPVPVAQRARRLVPQAGELADVVRHDRADRLRRLPCLPAPPRSSLARRICLISLSPTGVPPTWPRWPEKRMSTDASSSMMRVRSAAGTCFGRNESWSRSSRRRTSPVAVGRAASISANRPGSARTSESATSRSTRRRSCSSLASTLRSHQASESASWRGASCSSMRSATASGSATRASVRGRTGQPPSEIATMTLTTKSRSW